MSATQLVPETRVGLVLGDRKSASRLDAAGVVVDVGTRGLEAIPPMTPLLVYSVKLDPLRTG